MLFLGIPASNFSGIFGMVGTTENFQVLNNIVLPGWTKVANFRDYL